MKLNWTSRCVFTRKSFALLLLLFVGNLTVFAQAGSKAVKVTISPSQEILFLCVRRVILKQALRLDMARSLSTIKLRLPILRPTNQSFRPMD